jgi:hypothetical protein
MSLDHNGNSSGADDPADGDDFPASAPIGDSYQMGVIRPPASSSASSGAGEDHDADDAHTDDGMASADIMSVDHEPADDDDDDDSSTAAGAPRDEVSVNVTPRPPSPVKASAAGAGDASASDDAGDASAAGAGGASASDAGDASGSDASAASVDATIADARASTECASSADAPIATAARIEEALERARGLIALKSAKTREMMSPDDFRALLGFIDVPIDMIDDVISRLAEEGVVVLEMRGLQCAGVSLRPDRAASRAGQGPVAGAGALDRDRDRDHDSEPAMGVPSAAGVQATATNAVHVAEEDAAEDGATVRDDDDHAANRGHVSHETGTAASSAPPSPDDQMHKRVYLVGLTAPLLARASVQQEITDWFEVHGNVKVTFLRNVSVMMADYERASDARRALDVGRFNCDEETADVTDQHQCEFVAMVDGPRTDGDAVAWLDDSVVRGPVLNGKYRDDFARRSRRPQYSCDIAASREVAGVVSTLVRCRVPPEHAHSALSLREHSSACGFRARFFSSASGFFVEGIPADTGGDPTLLRRIGDRLVAESGGDDRGNIICVLQRVSNGTRSVASAVITSAERRDQLISSGGVTVTLDDKPLGLELVYVFFFLTFSLFFFSFSTCAH